MKLFDFKNFIYSNNHIIKLIFLLFLGFYNTYFYISKANTINSLADLSYRCMRFKDMNSCKSALLQAEELQLKEGFKQNYTCQTRLLGLEADLIITIIESSDSNQSLKIIDDINEVCIDQ
tara:strand:+ start:267 stop:626 length:360 start_codon:yes stop_codon:yes gene_type:complete